MAFLSPGVFIETVQNAPQTVQAVGTSTMSIVGWTSQGPNDSATLVTSPDAFTRTFGPYTNQSLVPIEVSAFFQNGGTRCYVVRVVPSDALTATSDITDSIVNENPAFVPAEDAMTLGPFVGTLIYHPLDASVITLRWLESAVSKTATITGTSTVGGANSASIASASIVRSTGVLTITFAMGHAPDVNSITASYIGSIWIMNSANAGAWGNNLKVTLAGNSNFLVYGPATTTNAGKYTKFNVTVSQLNASSVYEIKETYEEVVFTTTTDPMYFADVVNHGSDLITVTDMGYLNAPTVFTGAQHSAEVVGAGNGSTKSFSHTLASPAVLKTSLVVHYTIGAAPLTATANSDGTITGTSIDSTKTNTINWTTGLVTLNFSTAPDNMLNVTADYITVPTSSIDYSFSGASDGTIANITESTVSNFSALKSGKLGMYALDRIDEVMQLIIPDFAGDTSVTGDMLDYADARGDIFCILTTPKGLTASKAQDYKQITLNKKTQHGAMYWPWVVVQDPTSSIRQLTIPAVGHIAGIYARTDNTKNVSKAPAGVVDGALRGVISLEHNPDQGDRDTVYPVRINPLINTPSTGMAVWGARSMSPLNDATKYIQAVRLFEFVEKSILNSTQNYIFESISGNLYTTLKKQIDSFLLNLFQDGYFSGTNPNQAFQVICDTSNNPPDVVALGQVIVDVGIAPTVPGEFLRLRFAVLTASA